MARVLGANFQRVQFTPDTTPNELIGTMEMKGGELVLDRGAIFTNVLLADEINRTPPRVQAGLLVFGVNFATVLLVLGPRVLVGFGDR